MNMMEQSSKVLRGKETVEGTSPWRWREERVGRVRDKVFLDKIEAASSIEWNTNPKVNLNHNKTLSSFGLACHLTPTTKHTYISDFSVSTHSRTTIFFPLFFKVSDFIFLFIL